MGIDSVVGTGGEGQIDEESCGEGNRIVDVVLKGFGRDRSPETLEEIIYAHVAENSLRVKVC